MPVSAIRAGQGVSQRPGLCPFPSLSSEPQGCHRLWPRGSCLAGSCPHPCGPLLLAASPPAVEMGCKLFTSRVALSVLSLPRVPSRAPCDTVLPGLLGLAHFLRLTLFLDALVRYPVWCSSGGTRLVLCQGRAGSCGTDTFWNQAVVEMKRSPHCWVDKARKLSSPEWSGSEQGLNVCAARQVWSLPARGHRGDLGATG